MYSKHQRRLTQHTNSKGHLFIDKANIDNMLQYSHKINNPPKKGHCMFDLSKKDTALGPKNYHSLYTSYIENLWEEDNLSIKDTIAEFIL